MEKLDRPDVPDAVKETFKRIHGPARAIPQSLRNTVISGGWRIKKTVRPESSPWPRRFEILGVATACVMLIRKALGPKKV